MTATLYRDGTFVPDDWTFLDLEASVPDAGEAIVLPLERFLEVFSGLGPDLRLGVLVASGEDVSRLVPHLDRVEMIAVDFPVFSDGRGYSSARLLRQRMAFSGEIRAVGDVLLDQIPLMKRVGFTAFSITHEPTRRALEAGQDVGVPLYLQPAGCTHEVPGGARSWARRPSTGAQQY